MIVMGEIMNILALDCSTKTGWALLRNGTIYSGVQDFSKKRGDSNGMMFLRFSGWLKELGSLTEGKINVVVYEQAHLRGGSAAEVCVTLTGLAQRFAASIEAETMAPHTATIKKFATGNGRAGKEEMMAWFRRETGRDPVDDNEADAYAILRFTMNDLGVKV
jgi:Holliday junction resolvasome RuvABC endonuclease subunit